MPNLNKKQNVPVATPLSTKQETKSSRSAENATRSSANSSRGRPRRLPPPSAPSIPTPALTPASTSAPAPTPALTRASAPTPTRGAMEAVGRRPTAGTYSNSNTIPPRNRLPRSRQKAASSASAPTVTTPTVVPRILARPATAAQSQSESQTQNKNLSEPPASAPASNTPHRASNLSLMAESPRLMRRDTEPTREPPMEPPNQRRHASTTPAATAAAATPATTSPAATKQQTLDTISSFKHIQDQPRPSRLTLLASSGKLLDTVLRRNLSTLQTRTCIGAIGRTNSGKSTVMSELSGNNIFPANGMTQCVDFWVTPARVLLLDSPPVLALAAADKWPRRDGSMSRLATARLRDLQVCALMLNVCDTLVVVVKAPAGAGKAQKQQPERRRQVDERCLDRSLVKLIRNARDLAATIPGLSSAATLNSRQVSLHIVVNGHAKVASKTVADAYAMGTGVAVSRVTFLPTKSVLKQQQQLGPFADIAGRWAQKPQSPLLPLYPIPGGGAAAISSLVSSWDSLLGTSLPPMSFEMAAEELRTDLVVRNKRNEMVWRREEPEGAWMAGCLKAWDFIRRADVLFRAALVRDEDLDSMDL